MELFPTGRTWAEIDLFAAGKNFLKLKELIKGKLTLAVIKADAYGHGAVRLASLYSSLGCDFFAVSNIDEAISLRRSGIREEILVLGFVPPECAVIAARENISLTVFSLPFAKALSSFARRFAVRVKIHLKFDTGMGRIGFNTNFAGENSLDDALLAARLSGLFPTGAFTHFAVADAGEDIPAREFTQRQAERFRFAVDYVKSSGISLRVLHAKNSAAVLDFSGADFSMSRLGIALFGVYPSGCVCRRPELLPVMTLKSRISQIKTVLRGESVGYGRAFRAKKDMRVATVTLGYADGLFRSASAGGEITVRGKRAPIIGRICMDQVMADVSQIPNAAPFDEVIIFGKDAAESAESLARKCGTIPYELLCAVSKRVPRVYIPR